MLKIVLLFFFFNIFIGLTYSFIYPCSSESNEEGEPIQVSTLNFNAIDKKNEVKLNTTALKSILLQPDVADKELVILSIAGDLRKGKSFFLSLILQYLKEGGKGIGSNNNVKLSGGFRWKGGSKRVTQGIVMWSKPFCVKTSTGEEVAILLMDSAGAFDNQQTYGDTSTIFALSFLTSSVQLYNLMIQIQENDLRNLEVFTLYGTQISENTEPFQKLIFLIRDWMNIMEYSYGEKGGRKYLEDNLAIRDDQPEELKRLRNRLNSTFSSTNCYLMPHPGFKVAKGNFTPQDIEQEFVDKFDEFAASVFNPENLVIKQIFGKNVNGRQMFEYFKSYMDAFENKKSIKPETIFEATCRANHEVAFGETKVFYTNEMADKCSDLVPSSEPNELQRYYEKVREQMIDYFNEMKLNRCGESYKRYLFNLDNWMKEQYDDCSRLNMIKMINELKEKLKNSNQEKEFIETQTKELIQNFEEKLAIEIKLQSDTANKLNNYTIKLNFIEKRLHDTLFQLQKCDDQKDKCNKDKFTCKADNDNCGKQLTNCKADENYCQTEKSISNIKMAYCQSKKSSYLELMNTCNDEKSHLIEVVNFYKSHITANAGSYGTCTTHKDCGFCTGHNRCCFVPVMGLAVYPRGVCACTGDDAIKLYGKHGACFGH